MAASLRVRDINANVRTVTQCPLNKITPVTLRHGPYLKGPYSFACSTRTSYNREGTATTRLEIYIQPQSSVAVTQLRNNCFSCHLSRRDGSLSRACLLRGKVEGDVMRARSPPASPYIYILTGTAGIQYSSPLFIDQHRLAQLKLDIRADAIRFRRRR